MTETRRDKLVIAQLLSQKERYWTKHQRQHPEWTALARAAADLVARLRAAALSDSPLDAQAAAEVRHHLPSILNQHDWNTAKTTEA